MPKAIIIGAGIAGIAAAIRLAKKGYSVIVYEANSYPGGKLTEICNNGYRFDAGPSLFTMPQYVDDLFNIAGVERNFSYQKLDVVCRYFYEDGTQLTAYADDDKFVSEISVLVKEVPENIKRYFKNSAAIYQITNHVFLERSLHRLSTFLRWDTLKSILRFLKIDAFRSMHTANEDFFTDKRMIQFFDRYATYNGSNPYQAPATLNVIPHLEQHFGAYFPNGGMHNITTSLVNLADSLGVIFQYNSPVEEIILERSQARGVRVKNTAQHADIIVSAMDVWFTYNKLLAKHPATWPRKILKQQRSSSALIFYWGIKSSFPQLDLHNIFFSADYQAEFDAIWKQQTIYRDPTVYINISSKFKPDDAPDGCENWFVMINVPANNGQDWDSLIAEARTNITEKLSRRLGVDVSQYIACESVLDPRGIQNKTSSYQGSIYGTSSNGQFAAFLRHANRSAKVGNLYFCGGSVHPGGGIPLALLSAKIVADWIP